MKKLPFVISKKAVSDLEEIWLYTVKNWSVTQADCYYSICMNIDSGKSMDHVREGYRASKVKSHLMFYRVNNDTIEIVRILHKRMDIENRLTD